ncbi:hypothetical protein OESDEN_07772 [Oesophagostomum dentatum]|uniref:Uncharacterized protein n=1 Tax=Oesophagostomum dentatum TaxID=61180 RepID=A0A0B1T518_OESDE|nr:hypothetical protein OESDEN_07772 [Oesophagostomum dentatum]
MLICSISRQPSFREYLQSYLSKWTYCQAETEDDNASPSTSGEQMHTRSLRNQKPQQLSPTKSATPSKRALKTSPLKRNSANEIGSSPSQNGESKMSSPLPKKRQRSALSSNNDVIDFSPITRSGEKITRSKKSHMGPLSTSTPMPKSISKSPKRNKSLKEIKAEAVKAPEKKALKEEKEKAPANIPKTTRTRSQRSTLSNGSISSTSALASQRSDSKAKTSSSPTKPQTRSKRTLKTRGKAK